MKRVGTISASMGLIFLGIWMILGRENSNLGEKFFNWWPILIIVLGVEILICFGNRNDERKTGFNFLVVPILIIFLLISIFQGIFKGLRDFNLGDVLGLNDIGGIGQDFDRSRYNIIESSEVFEPGSKSVTFSSGNASVNLRTSLDGKVKIDSRVYVDKSSGRKEYNIPKTQNSDGYTIDMRETFIRKVEVDFYIPTGYDFKLDVNNLNLKKDSELLMSNLYVKSNNSNIDVSNMKSFILKTDNTNVRVKDIKEVDIDCNNPVIRIDGNTEILKIQGNNGNVDLNNILCRDININLDNGRVNVITEDKNVDLNIKINKGYYTVNGEKKVNSDFSREFGSGTNKVIIDMGNGIVSFLNK